MYREDGTSRKEELENNDELIDDIDAILRENFSRSSLEYSYLWEFLMERKTVENFAQSIREHADELAIQAAAKAFGDAHEQYPKNPEKHKNMDLHNNALGRQIAIAYAG